MRYAVWLLAALVLVNFGSRAILPGQMKGGDDWKAEVQKLEKRVAELERRVAQLERQLKQPRIFTFPIPRLELPFLFEWRLPPKRHGFGMPMPAPQPFVQPYYFPLEQALPLKDDGE